MSDIVTGSVVLIIDDVYEDDRYEVLEIGSQQAKLQGLYPREPIFCIDLKEEVIAEWRRLNDHSGI